MNMRSLLFVCALALPLSCWAEDAPTDARVKQLVRDFAFSFNPNLNTNTEFNIRHLEVKGLWEGLKLQVFDIEYLNRGQWFNGFVGIYHDGRITSLAPTIGGNGLMSGVMRNGEFYFTYSWGSGIHRSHVAKLEVADGNLKSWDSGGFQDADLFVSIGHDGKVKVHSGVFKGFNHWEAGKDIGFVETTNSSRLLIVDSKGEVITPAFPARTENSRQVDESKERQPISIGTNRAVSGVGPNNSR